MASSSVLDNMKRTTQATIEGFNHLDYDELRATRSDDFVYQFLPLSLGTPARNNEEYREFFFSNLKVLFQEFKVTPKSIVYDTDARKSVMHAMADVESVVGAYALELVMMLRFDEIGDKVTRIDEFFDSAIYSSFFAKVQEWKEQQDEKK